MFKGFNMHFNLNDDELHKKGMESFTKYSNDIKESLDSFIKTNGKIDGTRLQEEWFPQIDADFFISHSHNDEDLAITLAGWIKSRFGLNTFVDSCIWGHAEKLQQDLDNVY